MLKFIVCTISIISLVIYFFFISKEKFNTKKIILVGVFAAISIVLYMIPLIRYPQGGGITMLSMLPVMLLGLIVDWKLATLCGLIFGILKLINGGVIISPVQFILDYMLSTMILGFSGMFGNKNKLKIFMGCFFVGMLATFINTISGAIFFAQYAPVGMNAWAYSIIYNYSSAGVEALITAVVATFLPISLLKKQVLKI